MEIGQGVRPCEATLYQKVEICDIFGPHSHPPVPIEVKFFTATRTEVPVGPAQFDMNQCYEQCPGGAKNLIFGVWVSLIAAILPVKTYKHHVFAPTASAHCRIFPKLCMVIELVEAIKKVEVHFSVQRIVFPTGCNNHQRELFHCSVVYTVHCGVGAIIVTLVTLLGNRWRKLVLCAGFEGHWCTEGIVKVSLSLVRRSDTIYSVPWWRLRLSRQLRTGLTRKKAEHVRVRLRSRKNVQEFTPLKLWDQEYR